MRVYAYVWTLTDSIEIHIWIYYVHIKSQNNNGREIKPIFFYNVYIKLHHFCILNNKNSKNFILTKSIHNQLSKLHGFYYKAKDMYNQTDGKMYDIYKKKKGRSRGISGDIILTI